MALVSPHEQLLALGICQIEMAREGRLLEVETCRQARAELAASLPAVAPSEAQRLRERCLAIDAQFVAESHAAREIVLRALVEAGYRERGIVGYIPVRRRARLIDGDARGIGEAGGDSKAVLRGGPAQG